MEVWNALKETNAAFEVLEGFLKENPEAELCLDYKDIGNKANGNASYPDANNIITISINSNATALGRSQLSIARTILHEMIHAELIRMVVEAGGFRYFIQ